MAYTSTKKKEYNDNEDREPDTMYPEGYKSAPKYYMRMRIGYTNPRSFELYIHRKKKEKNKK